MEGRMAEIVGGHIVAKYLKIEDRSFVEVAPGLRSHLGEVGSRRPF